MRTHSPGAVLGIDQLLLKLSAYARTVGVNASMATKTGCISSEKIRLLLVQVSETWNITSIGPFAGCRIFRQPLIFSGYPSPIVVKGYILTQQTVVIAKTFGKPVR